MPDIFGLSVDQALSRVGWLDRAQGTARLTNRSRGLRFTLRFSECLPVLFEWKMTAPRHYVLGLEPANTPVILGRAAARAAGRLPRLAPSESVSYRLSFDVERI